MIPIGGALEWGAILGEGGRGARGTHGRRGRGRVAEARGQRPCALRGWTPARRVGAPSRRRAGQDSRPGFPRSRYGPGRLRSGDGRWSSRSPRLRSLTRPARASPAKSVRLGKDNLSRDSMSKTNIYIWQCPSLLAQQNSRNSIHHATCTLQLQIRPCSAVVSSALGAGAGVFPLARPVPPSTFSRAWQGAS